MITFYLVLLILALIISSAYGTRQILHCYQRGLARKRIRESRDALFGINPRKGRRKVIHQTVSIREQRLAWILAQNRDVIVEGIKAYARIQDVDNTSMYVDTFGVRQSLRNNRRLIRLILNRIVRGKIPLWDSTAEYLDRINKRTSLILRSLPRIINLSLRKLRSLIKLSSNKKGEINLGEDNSIH